MRESQLASKRSRTSSSGVLRAAFPQSGLNPKNLPATCGSCHQEVISAFTGSKHYQKLQESGTGPSCTTCHHHMATSVITWPPEASALCANCHNESGGPAANYLDAPEKAGDVIAAFSRADEVIDWTYFLIAEERKRPISELHLCALFPTPSVQPDAGRFLRRELFGPPRHRGLPAKSSGGKGVGEFLRNPQLNPNSDWARLAPQFDGKFQVSALRNVDKRPRPDFVKAYMHNGYFKSLKEVVHFYNTRDALPRCRHGAPGEKATCWPAPEFPQNMDKTIGNLRLTDEQENQIVAFLKTLTDGYKPQQAHERK
jgi:cytochrome c peroxidase